MDEITKIATDIKNGNVNPVYFLMGEEPYYIDKLSDYIESTVLAEEEKGFNQMVLYGRDVSIDDVIANAKRYPMMAERQVIIVKEAQDLARTIEDLTPYVKNPQQSTVLVLCYKYKKLDGRKSLLKELKKNSIVFESKKLYDNQVGDWIRRVLAGKKYTISFKAVQMLVEFLGTDLGKINNELEKLQLIIPAGTEITPDLIEKNIGISKDFNNFELRKAISERNVLKANMIINYFAQNPKKNPFPLTMFSLFSFFSNLLIYHGLSDKSPKSVSMALGISQFFTKEYQTAATNYPMKKVSQVVSTLREFDMKSKGVGAENMPQADLLKEMLAKILR